MKSIYLANVYARMFFVKKTFRNMLIFKASSMFQMLPLRGVEQNIAFFGNVFCSPPCSVRGGRFLNMVVSMRAKNAMMRVEPTAHK